jgi:hypothetical protein
MDSHIGGDMRLLLEAELNDAVSKIRAAYGMNRAVSS